MRKKIAIIGSGEMAVILANKAREMNLISYSFSNEENDRVNGHSDHHYKIDIFDTDTLIEKCKDLGVQGVLATTELTVSIAAKIASSLSLPGLPVDLADNITNKGFVRQKLVGCKSINQPEYKVIHNKDLVPDINNYPVIIKPTSLGGKRGVIVVDDEDSLIDAVNYTKQYLRNKDDKIIIEEFVSEGKEYSVECLSFDNKHYVIQITEKINSGAPHCVELGHLQYSDFDNSTKERIENAIVDLLKHIGLNNTASHIEIKVVNETIYLIELNSRLGGDHIAYPLTELSTGYDYIASTIKVALGELEYVDYAIFKKSNAGVIFITKQTKEFKELFEASDKYSWIFKKNHVTDELQEIINNQAFDTNYIIFKSDKGIPPEILDKLGV